MKIMVEKASEGAKEYLQDLAASEGVAYYEDGESAWITGEDEHLLETLVEEVKEDLIVGEDYDDIYLD